MDLDGSTLDAAVLETDVCVVGAGPAGLTLAHALAGGARDVVLVESGAFTSDPAVQRLNDARTIGDAYAGLRATRHRQVGGTAHLWNTPVGGGRGAKYVPLDAADVEGLPELPWSGWPLAWAELEPWYREARRVCGLAPEGGTARTVRPPLELGDAALENRLYELGSGDLFTESLPAAIRAAANVRLCTNATLRHLRPDRAGEAVVAAELAARGGARLAVRARTFVLATGAVENARALLASAGAAPSWLADVRDWIGRCFMEHPRDYALTLLPRPGVLDRAGFHDVHLSELGTLVAGRLALAERARGEERLPNLSITLLPHRRRRLHRVVGRRRYPSSESGWSATPERYDAFTVLLNLEQRPHRENRVVLGAGSDRLGVPVAELHWRWRAEDEVGLERTRSAVARELRAAGLGRVVVEAVRPDPNAHHHAGTTRMSSDAASGVVDADCRVHGTANLYVCGASVFPTAGFANPMLTIVALALRLAARLG